MEPIAKRRGRAKTRLRGDVLNRQPRRFKEVLGVADARLENPVRWGAASLFDKSPMQRAHTHRGTICQSTHL